jgi:hypothetical protein
MVTGYGGTYRGAVVDGADPWQQYRLGVVVPEVYGDDVSVWAVPLLPAGSGGAIPAVGDLVWVSFEHGDTDFPIWQTDSGAEQGGNAYGGYVGNYHGLVVGNDDPMQQNRLEVTVPEVDSSPAWATPSDDVRYIETSAVGSEVWVEYENGDPAYPRSVGLS